MKKELVLTTKRAVEMLREMLWYRREFCADSHFFRMTEYWDWLRSQNSDFSTKTYRSPPTEDWKRRAAIATLGGFVRLTVDEALLKNAERGCKLSNFILAHEVAHLGLGHHEKNLIVRNFQLFAGPNGMSNRPPTLEELEANIAAVFFQCGSALMDPSYDAVQLANLASSDIAYVRKAQQYVQLPAFQAELRRPKVVYPRVVF
jgi:hypothetical protein